MKVLFDVIMWKTIVAVLSLSGTTFSASIFHCPEGTICHEQGAIESHSFQFLDKLGPKQYQTIKKLTVSNALLDKVPAELKYLKKLEYFDLSDNNIQVSSIPLLPNLKTLKLSRNNIKDINLAILPKNIEVLDLSNNLLSQIPKDWRSLRDLKTFNLNKNLIDCDCYSNNIITYERLISEGIFIPEPIICYGPKHVAGKNINSINCSSDDEMINDQPEEGSGASEDIFSEDSVSQSPYRHEEHRLEASEIIDDKDEHPEVQLVVAEQKPETEALDEGSGDEDGSGFAPIEIEHIAACLFDCQTPKPVGVDDTNNDTGVIPGPTDQIKMIAEDVFQPLFAEPTPSTITTTTTTTPLPSTAISSTETSEDNEQTVIEVTQSVVHKAYELSNDIDIISNETRTGEMEKATAVSHNNYAVYIVVISGVLLAIVFMVCLIKKRKTKVLKKNRCELPARFGEEMKPLQKPSVQSVNEKNGKTPTNLPEHIPLINEQNGNAKDEPVLKSFIPLKNSESNLNNNQDYDLDEPFIRPKPELLTPLTERVTIRASELPESIPRTPVLVHRQKNSEGEIVTTVLPP